MKNNNETKIIFELGPTMTIVIMVILVSILAFCGLKHEFYAELDRDYFQMENRRVNLQITRFLSK